MSKIKIIIITANYYPEDTAIGLYTTQFAEFLSHKNYDVTVITGFPYYPQWKIPQGYTNKPNSYTETVNTVKIIRHRQHVPGKVTLAGRIRMMLSFLKGIYINIRKVKHADLVICIIPFTFSALAANSMSGRLKAKLWIHIQDFEFDLAFQSGILNDNIIFKPVKSFITSLEKRMLQKADVVSSISYSMLKKIKQKAKVKNPVYFPNWISSQKINPEKYNQHSYICPDKFSVLYSGNIGEKQDWQLFKELCGCVNNPDIEIVVVGDGGYLDRLKQEVAMFSFVKFYPPVPYEDLSNLLCSADIHLLFQKQDVIDSVMPSKILGMMASARPSIITGSQKSEVAEIIAKSNGGHYFYNASVETIYSEIETMLKNRVLANEMGKSARQFITEEFSEDKILLSIEMLIRNTVLK